MKFVKSCGDGLQAAHRGLKSEEDGFEAKNVCIQQVALSSISHAAIVLFRCAVRGCLLVVRNKHTKLCRPSKDSIRL